MREKLEQDYNLLAKQLNWLKISEKECKAIGIKEQYSIEEFEFENQGTLIDVINNAHKRGLFEDIEELRIMKDVRNTIVDEYIEDALIDVFYEVLAHSEKLILIIQNTLKYIDKKTK